MQPILDPRQGDIEDDASSTKRRTLISLAGSLLAEISLPKLIAAWLLLIIVPALLLGVAPLFASIWVSTISSKAAAIFSGLLPAVLLAILAAIGWFGGKPLWRLIETNFWSLNALAVQPMYAVAREALRQTAEWFLPADADQQTRNMTRAASAAASGLLICALAVWVLLLAWPGSRWTGSFADLSSITGLMRVALHNSLVIVAAYLAIAGLIWGLADTAMPQPCDYQYDGAAPGAAKTWRVVHLSDIHTVGERYGFRIEGGRAGPRGNERLRQAFAALEAIHMRDPLDLILITGDITDAGRAAEWAEFFEALRPHPTLAKRMLILPGNHDLNVIDRANPARLDLPTSPKKRLRELRALSAMAALQGDYVRRIDDDGKPGATLQEYVSARAADIATFADRGSFALTWKLADLWPQSFPMVYPPDGNDGLGVILLDSNAQTHFSFTNALGLVSQEQTKAAEKIAAHYPNASWIVALHHHVVEYPRPAKALSERIGTALVNGTWFVRRMQTLNGRAVVMHGHRHIDWIGQCGDVTILSAPSPVMDVTNDRDTYFYIHTLYRGPGGRLSLRQPERITLPGTAGETV